MYKYPEELVLTIEERKKLDTVVDIVLNDLPDVVDYIEEGGSLLNSPLKELVEEFGFTPVNTLYWLVKTGKIEEVTKLQKTDWHDAVYTEFDK